jgi:methionine aminopeptidase
MAWQGIEKMRAAGKLAAQVLQYAGTLVKVLTSNLNLHATMAWGH